MNKKHQNIIICLLIGLLIGLLGLLFNLFDKTVFFASIRDLEYKSIDLRINLNNLITANPKAPDVVIVAIDEQTLYTNMDKFNKRKLPRSIYGELIEKLNKLKVKTIGIDVFFGKENELSNKDNKILVDAISKYKNVILAATVIYYKDDIGNHYQNPFSDYLPEEYYGIVNLEPDEDGVIRRFEYSYPFMEFNFDTFKEETSYKPSFATAIVNNFDKSIINPQEIDSKTRNYKYISYLNSIKKIEVRSLQEFFNPKANEIFKVKDYKNKIVLIGNTVRTDKDYFEVPLKNKSETPFALSENVMPGVQVHAQIIQTIIDNNIIKELNFNINFTLVLLICLLIALILSITRTFLTSVLTIFATMIIYFIFSFLLFSCFNLITKLALPEIQIFLTGVFGWGYMYFSTNKEKNYIYNSFKKYLSPEVAKIASEKIENLAVQKKTVTLLFSDIAGFTAISENMEPSKLSYLLNTYLSKMGNIVFNNQGTLDKYIGDAVMAFWGAPVDIIDPEYKACLTALQMIEETTILNTQFQKDNLPALKIRIGINTADVMVGNLGGELFNYTAIGDGVNIASRLEGANKQFNSSILISQQTYENIKDRLLCRQLGKITVKGKTQSTVVYELLDVKETQNPEMKKFIQIFEEGLTYLKDKNWLKAEEKFKEVLEINPDDVISHTYLNHIEYLKQNNLPDDWDEIKITEK